MGCFRRLWKSLLPQITATKPRTDLCWQCYKNNFHLRRANLNDTEVAAKYQEQIDHLALAGRERELYQEMTAAAKKICEERQLTLGPSTPLSQDITMHYSFDFAQQVSTILSYADLFYFISLFMSQTQVAMMILMYLFCFLLISRFRYTTQLLLFKSAHCFFSRHASVAFLVYTVKA